MLPPLLVSNGVYSFPSLQKGRSPSLTCTRIRLFPYVPDNLRLTTFEDKNVLLPLGSRKCYPLWFFSVVLTLDLRGSFFGLVTQGRLTYYKCFFFLYVGVGTSFLFYNLLDSRLLYERKVYSDN